MVFHALVIGPDKYHFADYWSTGCQVDAEIGVLLILCSTDRLNDRNLPDFLALKDVEGYRPATISTSLADLHG
jgi:hypothetical protein